MFRYHFNWLELFSLVILKRMLMEVRDSFHFKFRFEKESIIECGFINRL